MFQVRSIQSFLFLRVIPQSDDAFCNLMNHIGNHAPDHEAVGFIYPDRGEVFVPWDESAEGTALIQKVASRWRTKISLRSILNVFFSCCKNTKNIRNSSLYPRLYFFLCFFREKLCYSAIYAYLCTRNWFAVATCRYRNGGGLRLKGNRVRSPDSPAAVNIFFRNEWHECHRGRTGKHLKGH